MKLRNDAHPKALRRAVKLLCSGPPTLVGGFAGLIALGSVFPVAQPVILGRLVDELAPVSGGLSGGLVALSLAYAATMLAPQVLGPVGTTVAAQLETHSVAAVDRQLMAASRQLPDLTLLDRPSFHDGVAAQREIPIWLPRFWSSAGRVLGSVMPIAGLFVVIGTLNILLPVALLTVIVPQILVDRRLHYLEYDAMADRSQAAREMDYCLRLATEPASATEVRIFGLGSFLRRRFDRNLTDAVAELGHIRLKYLTISMLVSSAHLIALVGGLAYVAYSVTHQRASVGDVALYMNAMIALERLLSGVGFHAGMLFRIYLLARELFAFVDRAGPGIELPQPGEGLRAPALVREGMELQGVGFSYPESSTLVLDGVDTLLPAGKVTALVGENGSGKSTLVKLLTRMYDPRSGTIWLDGRPLSAYTLDSLRSRISIVYQDFGRFAMAVRENIAIGDVEGSPDVERAVKMAGAETLVGQLPEGYEQMLSLRFAGGVELSGGEWQKVATARAFVREAGLIILDEPTSALDADGERAMAERFGELVDGRTALLISHRLSTVRLADHIVVLDKGRIVESGTHEALLRAGGQYAGLFRMQAGYYR